MILESFCPYHSRCRSWQRPAPVLHAAFLHQGIPPGLHSSVCATHEIGVMRVGRILLRNLLACERGLIEAYADALRRGDRSPRETELMTAAMEAHGRHARMLA